MISSDDLARTARTSNVSSVAEELQQVDAGQVARGVVQVDVLRAGVAGGDPARLRAGVPVVDRAVVLDARVGALPGGLGHLAEQRPWPRPSRSTSPVWRARRSKSRSSSTARMNSSDDPDRVVGVLVLDADDVLAAEVHVEARVAEDADLLLLARLGLDELLDVGVIDVEDDHLGRPPGGAAGLDRAGRGVGAAHERDRAAGRAARGQQLLAGADAGTGSRPAPEPPLKIRPSSRYQSRIESMCRPRPG